MLRKLTVGLTLLVAGLLIACSPTLSGDEPSARATVDVTRVIATEPALPTPMPPPSPTPTATAPPTRTPAVTADWSPLDPRPTNTLAPGETPPTPTPPITPTPVPPSPGFVYRDEQGLWLIQANWQPLFISRQVGALLSPDTMRLVYPEGEDYWLDDRRRESAYNLTAGIDGRLCCAQWWPARPDLLILGVDPEVNVGQLLLIDARGGESIWRDDVTGGFGLRDGSPDGQTIAFDRAGEPWLYQLDFGPRPLNPVDYGLPAGLRWGSPAWSPDGRYLAWAVAGDIGGRWQAAIAVLDMANQAGELRHLYEPIGRGGWFSAPTWSPDGRYLAFISEDQDPAARGAWLLEHDPSQSELYLGLSGTRPWWSPDGQWLLVAHARPDAPGERPVYRLHDIPSGYPLTVYLPDQAWLVDWLSPP